MADLRYQAEIDVRGAQSALESLKGSVASVTSAIAGAFAFKELTTTAAKFQDLRTSLQILYRDAAIGAKAFEEIKTFAATSSFSVEDLTQTVIKLKAAGLEPTVALLRMFNDVSSVATDKVGALQAITDLYARTTAGGLGLEDLNRLADRGIPVFDILQKKLGLNRLELSKFGQSAAGAKLLLKALEQGLTETFGGSSEIRAKNLSQAFGNFSDSVANAADGIGQSGLNQALTNLVTEMTKLIVKNQEFFNLIGKVFGAALQFLADNFRAVAVAAGTFMAVIAVGKLVAIIKAFSLLNAVIGKNPLIRLAMAAAAVAGTLFALNEVQDDTIKQADELNKSTDNQVIKEGKLADSKENLKAQVAGLNQALIKFRAEMNTVSVEFARYNQQVIDSINLETSLIGKTKEYQDAERARAEITKRSADEIAKLTAKRKALTEDELKEGRAGVIDEQIKKIEEIAKADLARTTSAINNSNLRQTAFKLEEFALSNQFKMEDELQSLKDIGNKTVLSEVEQKYYDIDAAAKKAAKSQIDAERVRLGRPLSKEEQAAYYNAAIEGTKALKEETLKQYEASRLFETGWRNAFRSYLDEATNAAKLAERIFQKATSGMEDMIVSFAKTGKFEFKGFVNSMLEELLRSQVRQLMAQIFNLGNSRGSVGGAGGLLGGFASILGFANGGIIPTNAPVLVGERGPELISGAAGRNVTPNYGLSGLGSTNVTYNINAVDAMSFKQMVAADPSFIYAVSQQGAKSIPQTRR